MHYEREGKERRGCVRVSSIQMRDGGGEIQTGAVDCDVLKNDIHTGRQGPW